MKNEDEATVKKKNVYVYVFRYSLKGETIVS